MWSDLSIFLTFENLIKRTIHFSDINIKFQWQMLDEMNDSWWDVLRFEGFKWQKIVFLFFFALLRLGYNYKT